MKYVSIWHIINYREGGVPPSLLNRNAFTVLEDQVYLLQLLYLEKIAIRVNSL
jgi:hypothetical protein